MPSFQKMIYFFSSALATAIAIALLGYGMSAEWASTTMLCADEGSQNYNGTARITLNLFEGKLERSFCPLFGSTDSFKVFNQFKENVQAPIILHGLVVFLLALCLLFSACTILISLYNSVSNPYETYMGPTGIYTCSSLSACLSFIVLILFMVNVGVTSMAEDLVKGFTKTVSLKDKTFQMSVGYFLVIPYTVLSLLAIALIFMYDHAAYTHKKEQQRPTEEAPKEIMMY